MVGKLEPLADRLVVKPSEKEEVTKSGIILPDTVKAKPQEGEVVAVGPGRLSEDGKRIAMDVKIKVGRRKKRNLVKGVMLIG